MQPADVSTNDFRFTEALEKTRGLLPVPQEISQIQPDDENITALISKLDQMSNTSEVISLAYKLRVSELRYVFPAFSHQQAQNKRLQDRLFLLIRERACHTMYNSAWNYFQLNPADLTLQKALALLCSILQIKLETSQELSFSTILRPSSSKQIDSGHDLRPGTLPLISEMAVPDSRNFIKRLSLVLAERNYELQTFFKHYGVMPDSVLAADLVSQSFLNRQHYTLKDQSLFRSSLEKASLSTQTELIENLLTADGLSQEVVNEYCKTIYQIFGTIENRNPVWQNVRENAKSVYRLWLIRATISTHCKTNPAKSRFYQRYFDFVTKVESFSSDTLLIHFGSFVIADNRKSLDAAIYYGGNLASQHPLEIEDEVEKSKDPASISVPHLTCEEALRTGESLETVILYFNHAQIKNSSAFIDFCLQQNNGSFRTLRRRFFG